MADEKWIRREGRWMRAGEQFRERGRLLRKVASRFWYLLVPFIGIMCADSTYVRPDTEEIKSQKALDRKRTLDVIDDTRAEISRLQSEVVVISAELDTVHLPKVKLYGALLDSLLAIRRIYDEELPRTKARIDSLQDEHDLIVAEIDQLSGDFQHKSATLDSLNDWQATLADSIERLDDLIVLRTDQLYRLRHPKEFRGKEALFTGEGEYPRRDETPQREKE
ncbi:MAG: hypothetical protein GF330_05420 [Candidatus Eisenbacteria bacterium]|nr:hypothetical protein [Candidatus Eisenbacteria bacterium]